MEPVFHSDLATLFRLQPNNGDLPSELRHLSYRFTCQLSVLYGLHKSDPKALSTVTDLTVHVVGARLAESADVERWEVAAAFAGRLRNLTVVFIGPELR